MVAGLKAAIIAPFPAALAQALVVAIWPKEEGVFAHPLSMYVAICLYFWVFGVLVGAPTWLALRRRLGVWRAALVAGVSAGLVPVGLALAWTMLNGELSAYAILYNLALFGLGGLAAGALWWRIAARPDAAQT